MKFLRQFDDIEQRFMDIGAPTPGTVTYLTGTLTATSVEIPQSWDGAVCDFSCDNLCQASITDAPITVVLNSAAAITNNVIVPSAVAGGKIPAGGMRSWRFPYRNTGGKLYLNYIMSGGTGMLCIEVNDGLRLAQQTS